MPISFEEPREARAVQHSLWLKNWSSSAETAHANTEAGVSGHCLDYSGKYMEEVGKKREFF